MDLYLKRMDFRQDGIFGEITSADFTCFTLEHAYSNNGHGFEPKIPIGSYTCVRGTHQLEHGGPFETFEVTNVPGHPGVLLHVGNYNQDSNGCILLGESVVTGSEDGIQGITNSRVTFDKFMAIQEGVDTFILTVE